MGFLGRLYNVIFHFRVVIIWEASYLPWRPSFNNVTSEDFCATGVINLYIFTVEMPFFIISFKINSRSHFNVEILMSKREG